MALAGFFLERDALNVWGVVKFATKNVSIENAPMECG
jgi:hypothetical protein